MSEEEIEYHLLANNGASTCRPLKEGGADPDIVERVLVNLFTDDLLEMTPGRPKETESRRDVTGAKVRTTGAGTTRKIELQRKLGI